MSKQNPEHVPVGMVLFILACIAGFIYWKATSTNSPASSSPSPQQAAATEPPRSSANSEEAKELAATMANMNGHLCAKVLEIRPLKVRPEIHEITCIEYRGGAGRKVYLLDSNKGTVWVP